MKSTYKMEKEKTYGMRTPLKSKKDIYIYGCCTDVVLQGYNGCSGRSLGVSVGVGFFQDLERVRGPVASLCVEGNERIAHELSSI